MAKESYEYVKKMQRIIEDRIISIQEIALEIDEYNDLYLKLEKLRDCLRLAAGAEYNIWRFEND